MDRLYGFLAMKIFSNSSTNSSLQHIRIGLVDLVCVSLLLS
jgi:hypothetical protein